MTTKKKSAPKSGEKSKKNTAAKGTAGKALTEPTAVATSAAPKTDKIPVAAKAEAVAPKIEAVAPATPKAVEVSTSTEKPVLTIGMFQKRLHEHGYYQGWWDGQYGPLTKQAVATFQAAHGLHPDGEPTPATLTALGF